MEKETIGYKLIVIHAPCKKFTHIVNKKMNQLNNGHMISTNTSQMTNKYGSMLSFISHQGSVNYNDNTNHYMAMTLLK